MDWSKPDVSGSSPWERWALAGGVVFVALLISAGLALPSPPESGTAAHYAAWFLRHRTAALTQVYLRGLAAPFELIFAVGILAALRRVRGSSGTLELLILAGALGHSAMLLVSNGATAAAAMISGPSADAGTVYALSNLSEAMLTVEAFMGVLVIGGASVALLRAQAASRWVCWFGIAASLLAVCDAASFPGSPVEFFGFIGLITELVWFLWASISLLLRARAQRPVEQERSRAVAA